MPTTPPNDTKCGHRVFYSFSNSENVNNETPFSEQDVYGDHDNKKSNELMRTINRSFIGNDVTFESPFGRRRVLYADFVASGKPVSFIEDFISNEVLPYYGNTHTTTSVTSLQMTMFRHEARDVIRNAVRARENDVVLFSGSGATAAIKKLIHNLSFTKKPVVIVGPYEHHSNLLPWKHLCERFHRIEVNAVGVVSFGHLKSLLELESPLCKNEGRNILVCLAAASNVTGILAKVNSVTNLVHEYNGLVFWDYASAAPYISIDMNPVSEDNLQLHKDAVFFSTHKFPGGPQSSGILVAKRSLFKGGELQPEVPAGGTVFFVRRENQIYLSDIQEREEGGTPAIVEDIRAGLAMKLKMTVGVDAIMRREFDILDEMWTRLQDVPNLLILGPRNVPRLPILSFMVSFTILPENKRLLLHHNFVAALLNDLFGIQSRGGCACAGPYAMDLLGIDEDLATRYEEALIGVGMEEFARANYLQFPHREILRPGFVRVSLPYVMAKEEVRFVLDAIAFVAEHGWSFLPFYSYDPVTSSWCYRNFDPLKERKWLNHATFGEVVPERAPKIDAPHWPECMSLAQSVQQGNVRKIKSGALPPVVDDTVSLEASLKELRWFVLPIEVVATVRDSFGQLSDPAVPSCPFWPPSWDVARDTTTVSTSASKEESFSMYTAYSNIKSSFVPSEWPSSSQPVTSKQICPKKAGLGDRSSDSRHDRWLRSIKRGVLNGALWRNPPPVLFSGFLQAVRLFDMVHPGDRVMVCISGGKDSLSLLHCLHQYQSVMLREQAKCRGVSMAAFRHLAKDDPTYTFQLGAVTVDPESASYDPSPLIPYMRALGVAYFYERQGIVRQAEELPSGCESICSFCSRMKRGRIYAAARRNSFNVVALGQHLDDLTESFLMAAFHEGALNTMKANYVVKDSDLRVIRPLVFCRESMTREFADKAELPVIPENCPACFKMPKERVRMKRLLAEQEVLFPELFSNLRSALVPLMSNPKASGLNALLNAAQSLASVSRLQLNGNDGEGHTSAQVTSINLSDSNSD